MSIHNRSRYRPSSLRELAALGGLGLLWLAAAMFCIAALTSTARATPVSFTYDHAEPLPVGDPNTLRTGASAPR